MGGVAAASLLASAKQSGLPSLVIALAAGLALLRVKRVATPAAVAAALAPPVFLVLPWIVHVWQHTGSPTYPLALKAFGRTIFPGNRELMDIYAGRVEPRPEAYTSTRRLLSELFLARFDERADSVRWGFFTPAAVVLAWSALVSFARDRARAAVALVALAAAVIPLLAMLGDDFAGLRAHWGTNIARLLMAIPAVLWVLTSCAPDRAATVALVAAALLGVVTSPPTGTGPLVSSAMREVLPGLGLGFVVAAALGALVSLRSRRPVAAVLLSVWALVLVAAGPVERTRRAYRYRLYADAVAHPTETYELHPLRPDYAEAFGLWAFLDDGRPHRIAVAVGWEGLGHNGYRYPFYGSRLQNEVSWVPNTRDGRVIDYRDAEALAREVDPARWVARLDAARVDYVAVLHPAPVERGWMDAMPRRFRRVLASRRYGHALYQVLR